MQWSKTTAQIKIGGFAYGWFEQSFNFSNQHVDLSDIIDDDATWVLCSVFRVMLSKIHFSKKKNRVKKTITSLVLSPYHENTFITGHASCADLFHHWLWSLSKQHDVPMY